MSEEGSRLAEQLKKEIDDLFSQKEKMQADSEEIAGIDDFVDALVETLGAHEYELSPGQKSLLRQKESPKASTKKEKVLSDKKLSEKHRKTLIEALQKKGFKINNIRVDKKQSHKGMRQGMESRAENTGGGANVASHPDLDTRGMPLDNIFSQIDVDVKVAESAENRAESRPELTLTLNLKQKLAMEGPKPSAPSQKITFKAKPTSTPKLKPGT